MIRQTIQVVPPPKHGVRAFSRWVAEHCGEDTDALEIGAGKRLSGPLRPLLRRRPYVVGIDPDPSILDNPALDRRYQTSLEDFAEAHRQEFDVAFAIYVLEHVDDPAAFTAACAQVLRPGGHFFALTLNRYQYFGLITWTATRLGIADQVLERLKGPAAVERYHFRTEYRLNSVSTVTRHLEAAGFSAVDFRCFEEPHRYQWYLPAFLQWFPHAHTRAAYRLNAPWLMGHLSFHATTPG